MRAVGFHSETSQDRSTSYGSWDVSASVGRLNARSEIELYCQRNSHLIIKWYEPSESETANDFDARDDRYRQMVALFTGPDARTALVLVPDASHLAEDLETLVHRLLELDDVGAEVRCTDPDRPDALQSGEQLLGLMGRSHQRQSRIRVAISAKAARGEVLGRTPYGYEGGVDGLLKPVPGESRIVKEIFETYAGPMPVERSQPTGGPGLRAIARSLNDRGLRTRTGRPWSAVAIGGILKNRAYIGTYTRYGVRIAGNHEPLVTRKLFNRAETVTKSRKPDRQLSSQPPYILGGVVRCEVCGRGLFGLTRRRSWKKTDGTISSKTYRYYECPSRDARRERLCEIAPHSSWHAKDLELKVINDIDSWGDRIKNRLRPSTNRSVGDELAEAEREFSRAVRVVASAYGTLNDLKIPLRRLEGLRDERVVEDVHCINIERLYRDIRGDDIVAAKSAIAAIVERVIARRDTVEVLPRF